MSATEPGAKHSSNRRRQPLCPIVGWLGRGAIAFAKFGGEDGDMTCVEHRQAVDLGKARQRAGRRAREEHRRVAKGARGGENGNETLLMGGEAPPGEGRSPYPPRGDGFDHLICLLVCV